MTSRLSALVVLSLATALGVTLFITSEHVQRKEKDLAVIHDRLEHERDALRVLNAEWTYLNRPDRLEQLARTYLQLAPGTAAQVMRDPNAIPEPFNPIMPGVKPDFIPAHFIKEATAPAPVPAPARPRTPPQTTLTFNQLINRVAQPPTIP